MENRTKRDLALISLVSDYENMTNKGNPIVMKEQSYLHLIKYYEEERRMDKAFDVVEFALQHFPFRSEFYITKARILFAQQKLTQSLEILDFVENIAPFELDIRILRAKVLAAQGKFDEALLITNDLQSYSTISDQVEIHVCESYIYEWMNDYEAMFQSLKKALILNPQHNDSLERVWLSVELSKKFDESILLHNLIIDKYPYNHLAWFNLGHAHECMGEYEKAIDALEYSFLIENDFEPGYLDCADLCFQINDFERALDIYREANDIFGPDPEILMNLAHCQFKTNQVDQCQKSLVSALKIDPYNDEAFYLLANCYMSKNMWTEALSSIEDALLIDNEREEYYHSAARCYVNLGKFKKAKQCYAEAATAGQEIAMYWEEYIAFLIQINDYLEAFAVLKKAENYTYSDKLMYCKAVIFLKLNYKKRGLEALEEALVENYENHKFFLDLEPALRNDQNILSMIKYYMGETSQMNKN